MRLRPALTSLAAVLVVLGCAVGAAMPALAQSNDDDRTPLGSRIARDVPGRDWGMRMRTVNSDRRSRLFSQLGDCVYERSPTQADWYIQATDYGIADYAQIGLTGPEVFERLSLVDCMQRAANNSRSSMRLQLRAGNLRTILLQYRYFQLYPEGPDWIDQTAPLTPHVLPISAEAPAVRAAMDFADCVVRAGPETADYYVRVYEDDALKDEALQALMPLLGPCLAQGSEIELTGYALRALLTEGLWHAAISNSGNAS